MALGVITEVDHSPVEVPISVIEDYCFSPYRDYPAVATHQFELALQMSALDKLNIVDGKLLGPHTHQ